MLSRIYLEITNVCNRSCAFCPSTQRPARTMRPEEFSLLAAKLRPHADNLHLHVMGEPLVHPQLEEILARAEGWASAWCSRRTERYSRRGSRRCWMRRACTRCTSACIRLRQMTPEILRRIWTAVRRSVLRHQSAACWSTIACGIWTARSRAV